MDISANEADDDVKREVNRVARNYVAGVGYRLGHSPAVGGHSDGGASGATPTPRQVASF